MDTHLFLSASVPTSVDFHGELALVVYALYRVRVSPFSKSCSHVANIMAYGSCAALINPYTIRVPVCPVCVPAPPGVFLPVHLHSIPKHETGVGVGPLYKHEK